MKRREAFKKLGLLAIIGSSSISLLSSFKNTDTADTSITKDLSAAAGLDPSMEKRNKLIVNRNHYSFADPDNPTKSELKHTPDISLGKKDSQGHTLVQITIGMQGIIHPSTKEHWIDFISVYLNDEQISFTEYRNGGIRGFQDFYVKLNKGDKIKAVSGCNIHGIYSSSILV